ncbi:MAG: hypothetical protein ACJATP_003805 [Candidatus Azotimanducaceae bacterium]|jgi:hypothetical protein
MGNRLLCVVIGSKSGTFGVENGLELLGYSLYNVTRALSKCVE